MLNWARTIVRVQCPLWSNDEPRTQKRVIPKKLSYFIINISSSTDIKLLNDVHEKEGSNEGNRIRRRIINKEYEWWSICIKQNSTWNRLVIAYTTLFLCERRYIIDVITITSIVNIYYLLSLLFSSTSISVFDISGDHINPCYFIETTLWSSK